MTRLTRSAVATSDGELTWFDEIRDGRSGNPGGFELDGRPIRRQRGLELLASRNVKLGGLRLV